MRELESFKKDFKQKFNIPFYNDDSDYTTNSPSYYDYLARKNKLLKVLAKRIWEYDKILYEKLKELIELMDQVLDVIGEGFNEVIEKLFRKWVADGTLDHIINDVLLEEINNKVDNLYNDFDDYKEDIELMINNFKEDIELMINNFKNELLELLEKRVAIFTQYNEPTEDIKNMYWFRGVYR